MKKKLKKGFYICPACEGSGMGSDERFKVLRMCGVCDGSGKISWVDAIRKGIKIHKDARR